MAPNADPEAHEAAISTSSSAEHQKNTNMSCMLSTVSLRSREPTPFPEVASRISEPLRLSGTARAPRADNEIWRGEIHETTRDSCCRPDCPAPAGGHRSRDAFD